VCKESVLVIMAPKHDKQPVVKGKGNLMKVPTKGDLEKDAAILAMRWTWRLVMYFQA